MSREKGKKRKKWRGTSGGGGGGDEMIMIKVSPSPTLLTSPNVDGNKIQMDNVNKPRSRLNSQGHLDLKFYHSSLW